MKSIDQFYNIFPVLSSVPLHRYHQGSKFRDCVSHIMRKVLIKPQFNNQQFFFFVFFYNDQFLLMKFPGSAKITNNKLGIDMKRNQTEKTASK